MRPKAKEIILYTALLIIGVYFLILGLHTARSFLVPIFIAVLLALVMLPVTQKLESWRVPKGLSVLISDLLILGFCVGLMFVLGAKLNTMAEDWPQYEKQLKPRLEQVQQFVQNKTGISPNEQEKKIKDSIQKNGSKASAFFGSFLTGFLTAAGNFLLVFIYIFFFLFYRKKFKRSILKFIPSDHQDKGEEILHNFGRVSQSYLFGRFLLIVILAVLYAIGLSLSGIEQAILIAIIAAVLSLIPYIGNMIGVVLAVVLGALTSDDVGSALIGIAITFTIAQFVESYILEPYVVGQQVDLNPVLTILGVVAGSAVWGVAGMIIAIPVMGIIKVVCDQIDVLRPIGYLLGEEGIEESKGLTDRVKRWFS